MEPSIEQLKIDLLKAEAEIAAGKTKIEHYEKIIATERFFHPAGTIPVSQSTLQDLADAGDTLKRIIDRPPDKKSSDWIHSRTYQIHELPEYEAATLKFSTFKSLLRCF